MLALTVNYKQLTIIWLPYGYCTCHKKLEFFRETSRLASTVISECPRNFLQSRFVQFAVCVCAVCGVAVNVNRSPLTTFWSAETSIKDKNKQTTYVIHTWDSAHQWLRANDEWRITSLLCAHEHCNYTLWINHHTPCKVVEMYQLHIRSKSSVLGFSCSSRLAFPAHFVHCVAHFFVCS